MLAATAAGVLPACARFGTGVGSAERPNILLIFADDVGREVLGCYGGTSYSTPNLDSLAASGTRFDHAYAMPTCHPSRISLLTGRYPTTLGNPLWGSFPEAEEANTLAHTLKRAGYDTAIAGKWQIAQLEDDPLHPQRLGFDQSSLFGWHEGPRYHDPLIWQNGTIREGTEGQYGPDLYTDFLIDFMQAPRNNPFFAFHSMALCHDVTNDLDEPVPYGARGRYDNLPEMVAEMDRQIGKVLTALDQSGLRDNTLILFTTDNGTAKRTIVRAENGEYIREPNTSMMNGAAIPGGKGDLTDWGTRVPTLASWPGVVPAGCSVDGLVDLSDLLPTFAEIAEAPLPSDINLDGASFAPLLRGDTDTGRPWVYAEKRDGNRWVRTQRWKLYHDGRFFDMDADPEETTPLRFAMLTGESAQAYTKLSAALQPYLPR
jgi:arylsulfatase A-like enzyme